MTIRAADASDAPQIVDISAANPGGVAFHAAIGYRQVATLREVGFRFDQWLDFVLMQECL